MSATDPYELLGVSPDDDAATLAAARRRKAFEVHPDRGGSDEAMQAVNEAYRVVLRNLVAPPSAAPRYGKCARSIPATAGAARS